MEGGIRPAGLVFAPCALRVGKPQSHEKCPGWPCLICVHAGNRRTAERPLSAHRLWFGGVYSWSAVKGFLFWRMGSCSVTGRSLSLGPSLLTCNMLSDSVISTHSHFLNQTSELPFLLNKEPKSKLCKAVGSGSSSGSTVSHKCEIWWTCPQNFTADFDEVAYLRITIWGCRPTGNTIGLVIIESLRTRFLWLCYSKDTATPSLRFKI